MLDADGPGVVTRVWHTSSSSIDPRFNIYIDDDPIPVVSSRRNALFNRDLDYPFVDLFVGDAGNSAGGYYCYFPIPFAEHIRITAADFKGEDDDAESLHRFYYNIDYLIFPQETDITSFSGTLSETDQANFQAILDMWYALGDNPVADSSAVILQGSTVLLPHVVDTLAYITGTHYITEISIFVDPSHEDTLKNLVLSARWDDEEEASINVPLWSFFGNPLERGFFNSLPLGSTGNGFYSYFPMPFHSSALLTIENVGDEEVPADFRIAYGELDGPGPQYRFHTEYREETPTTSGTNYAVLEVSGQGHYVGTTLGIESDHDWSILEGDEMLYVDGESMPSIHGTGTEDYFNCGWYFYDQDSLSLPYHGLSLLQHDSLGLCGVSAHRFHIPDPIPFNSSLKVTFEHGPVNDLNANYFSVAYYYLHECPTNTPGDLNCDGTADVGDAVHLLNYLYRGGDPPVPMEAGDVNCDGVVDVGDVVFLINYLYKGGDPPGCP
jgi:hypothetical protein